jgi:cbb3-type cytochrome oxidase maturation protein
MEILFVLIGFSTLLAVLFLSLFFKSVKNGQYEDTYTPSVRMLFDDELVADSSQHEDSQESPAVKHPNT